MTPRTTFWSIWSTMMTMPRTHIGHAETFGSAWLAPVPVGHARFEFRARAAIPSRPWSCASSIAVALFAVLAGVAWWLERRRRPDAPTQPHAAETPAQLDRADFPRPDAPWLVVLFTSRTCESCAGLYEKALPLESRRRRGGRGRVHGPSRSARALPRRRRAAHARRRRRRRRARVVPRRLQRDRSLERGGRAARVTRTPTRRRSLVGAREHVGGIAHLAAQQTVALRSASSSVPSACTIMRGPPTLRPIASSTSRSTSSAFERLAFEQRCARPTRGRRGTR